MGDFSKTTGLLILLLALPLASQSQASGQETISGQVDSLVRISRLLTEQHDYSKALETSIMATKLAREKMGDASLEYGNACFNHGRVLHKKGRYSDAESWYVQSKIIREKTLGNRHPDYASSLNNLAFLYVDIAQYEKAETLYLEARAIREQTLGPEHPDFASCLHNLAILYYFMGKYEKAEPLYLESKSIRAKTLGKEHSDYAWSLNNLANLYRDLGDFKKAEALYFEAGAIWKKNLGEGHPNYAENLNNLGFMYWRAGNYERAEPLYLEAKAIWEKTFGRAHPKYASSLHNLGVLYRERGQYKRVENLYFEILAIKEKMYGKEHTSYAESLHNLGFLYWQMGKHQDAQAYYLEAKSIRKKILGEEHPEYMESLYNLAALHIKVGEFKEAEPLINELSILNQKLIYKSLNHLSEEELNHYLHKFSEIQAQAFSFAQMRANANTRLPQLCFDNILFYKGFILNAAKQIKRLVLIDSLTAEKFHRLKEYGHRLAKEYSKPISDRLQVAEIEEEANALEKALTRAAAGYGDAMRPITWREVQSALQPTEAAIEFIHFHYQTPKPTDSTLYAALLLRPGWDAPRWITLFEEKQLLPLLNASQARKVGYASQLFDNINANSLYELLWKPLEPHLKGVEHIYFSPSGILQRIPLAAIEIAENETLGERYMLYQLGSTRQLARPAATPREVKTAVIFGGIRYDMDSTAITTASQYAASRPAERDANHPDAAPQYQAPWKYLPWTEVEAKMLDALFKQAGMRAQLQLGYHASEQVFRNIGIGAPSPQVLHVATHGYFFPEPASTGRGQPAVGDELVFKISEHPMIRCGLLMAGANHVWTGAPPLKGMEDGVLTAYEVSLMNLSETELVVLSACETGLGDIQGSEGVYGLQRAFKIAGAKYVLMSLWQVPDYATQELMYHFYANWLIDGLPIPNAFRNAQQQMKLLRPEPFYWAGFVLVE